MVMNDDAHPFSRWLVCPTYANDADPPLVTDADDTLRCANCETQLDLTEVPAFLEWVQCPACGFNSTVEFSLDNNGGLRVECSQCSRLYHAGQNNGDSSA